MNAARLLPLMILTASFAAGCDPEMLEDDGSDETVSLRPGGSGGIWLNTSSIGSKEFAAFDLTGQLHDGVRLVEAKVKINGTLQKVASGEVIDGNIRVKVGTKYYTGAALVDSRWKISIPNYDYNYDDDEGEDDDDHDRTVELWISSYAAVSAKEGHYTFQYLNEQGQPTYLCDSAADGSRVAVPVRNISVNRDTGDLIPRNYTAYLACTSGAIGKAITWGYKPWERSLPDLEVASRMVRADYCFDGMSWTETGTALQVRDSFAINDFLNTTAPDEVVWTTTGVACLSLPRNPLYAAPQVTCNGQPLPACPSDLTLTTYPNARFWTKLGVAQ